LILLIFAAGWRNLFVVRNLRVAFFGCGRAYKVTAKNVSVLFGAVRDFFKIWNLGYQQVIHNAKTFTTAHLLSVFVAI